jgi:penicillin-binding protein 2
VHGKTGTAERQPNADQSWYACWVDDPSRPIVVVVTVEEGGFGAEAAAPAARLILEKWFGIGGGDFVQGESRTQ